ncbi:MAG: hypothetical protein ABEN55_11240 [Bradymonadaceae bacterium]
MSIPIKTPITAGGCGQTCGQQEVCSSGSCEDDCASGQTACSGNCVDTSSDNNHCGSCGTSCTGCQSCSNGTCSDDDSKCNGSNVCNGGNCQCVDNRSDSEVCNDAGASCGTVTDNCGDTRNCGGCSGCNTCSSNTCTGDDAKCSNDGWFDDGNAYDCCDSGRACTCQDREYRDYQCRGGTCSFKVTDTRTSTSGCSSCDDSDSCTSDSCQNGACTHNSYCSGTDSSCGCRSCKDCNNDDGWYDTGSTYSCCDGGSSCTCQDQEYRDYSCNGGTNCDYNVTNTRTVKNGCTNDCTDDGWKDDGSPYRCCKDSTTLCLDCQNQDYYSGSCSSGSCSQSVTDERTVYNNCLTCTRSGHTCACSSAECTSLCM